MPVQLDYHKPPVRSRIRLIALAGALAVSLVAHLVVFRYFIDSIRNDVRFNRCFAISLGYWLVVLLIVARSRLKPTIVDLVVIGLGYPAAVFVCDVAIKDGL
jgi:hypothetical protein